MVQETETSNKKKKKLRIQKNVSRKKISKSMRKKTRNPETKKNNSKEK